MNIYDYEVKKRDGGTLKLSDLKGKVLLIVNTATGCGFTPQYEGKVVYRFGPTDEPSDFADKIRELVEK